MKTTRSPSKHGTGYGTSDFPKAPASLVLRLFAAWLVVVGHCPGIQGRSDQDFLAQWTHGRFSAAPLGITIFFVLSGYLVAGSASRSRDWIDFTWRRVRRIAPGWIACWMLVCLVLGPFATRLDLGAYWGGGVLLRTMLGFVGSAHWELPGVFMDHALRSANG